MTKVKTTNKPTKLYLLISAHDGVLDEPRAFQTRQGVLQAFNHYARTAGTYISSGNADFSESPDDALVVCLDIETLELTLV